MAALISTRKWTGEANNRLELPAGGYTEMGKQANGRRCVVCGGVVDRDPSSEVRGDATYAIPGLGVGRLHQHREPGVCIRELRSLVRKMAVELDEELRIPLDRDAGDIETRIAHMLLFIEDNDD